MKGDVTLPLIDKVVKEGLFKLGDDAGVVDITGRLWTVCKKNSGVPPPGAQSVLKSGGGVLDRFKEELSILLRKGVCQGGTYSASRCESAR